MGGEVPGVVLRPSGDLDLATVDAFRDAVTDALGGRPSALVVDLSDVPFVDSSGLGVLAGALRTQRQHGGVLVVVHPQPIVRRAIDLVGLDLLLEAGGLPVELRTSVGL